MSSILPRALDDSRKQGVQVGKKVTAKDVTFIVEIVDCVHIFELDLMARNCDKLLLGFR
jgi:hypothetical protein